ncbi:MAG: UDP-N-acetylmuramate dehydrogenase [Nitrosomonadales bacterium]|jgi:UDP-N-acetylmuramate dehydrogenase|nr:UDP-N-acetylmuramate dehydrogenase [Nitrosomonadales bacterium]MBT5573580.1 UDP-N-acetylmuramate dehydrogenase [Nitrosomonadales bacterium]MBT6014547.1 UDP-N-acetylmuramate dehydrogenase [Nitrosomonadales bacterium]MBT6602375.1 UDP-N-acetylmuramate dehydrogenase [Nitrosomonadales bacterium]MBT7407071.1 UDP-N-acetylmuramate dehydrogenase [Nitrosomonadales bacterium]
MEKNKVYKNVSLTKFNSWKVGGAAENFVICSDINFLSRLIQNEKVQRPIKFIGLGSNILVRDNGIKGTAIVMHKGLNKFSKEGELFYSEAGLSCSKFSKLVAKDGYSDSAFLSGIPGTIGGALAMNAGCYGSEIWGYVKKVKMISSKGELIERDVNEFNVGYRQIVKKYEQENFVGAWFSFPKGKKEEAEEDIRKLLVHRKSTQPLNWPSAGSTFKNPEKNHAAKLIEECGLKGFKIGDAKISEKHANFIINLGSAKAKDIEDLINYVKEIVFKEKKIKLIPEVEIIGDL